MKAPVTNLRLITNPSPYIVQNPDCFFISGAIVVRIHNVCKHQKQRTSRDMIYVHCTVFEIQVCKALAKKLSSQF